MIPLDNFIASDTETFICEKKKEHMQKRQEKFRELFWESLNETLDKFFKNHLNS